MDIGNNNVRVFLLVDLVGTLSILCGMDMAEKELQVLYHGVKEFLFIFCNKDGNIFYFMRH
jgi:hypothetical protein